MAKDKENKEDKQVTMVKITDFLNKKEVSIKRHIGFLDTQFENYSSVKGGEL